MYLIQCSRLSNNDLTCSLPQYQNLFCDDVQKIAKIGRLLLKSKHKNFKKIIHNKPDAPAVSTAASAVSNNCNGCIGN